MEGVVLRPLRRCHPTSTTSAEAAMELRSEGRSSVRVRWGLGMSPSLFLPSSYCFPRVQAWEGGRPEQGEWGGSPGRLGHS